MWRSRGSTKTDWEVELGVIIGKPAKYVEEKDALSHVAGYCVVNDLSERAFQLESTGQWVKGKSADTFGPIGPWFVTGDEIADPKNLHLWLEVEPSLSEWIDLDNGLWSGASGELHQQVYEFADGRHYFHRHASRGWIGTEATNLLACRKSNPIGH